MKKIFNSIFRLKRIPIIIAFVLLTVVFFLICSMFFEKKEKVQEKPESTPEVSQPIETPPVIKEIPEIPEIVHPTREELYAQYRDTFTDMRLPEQNTLCILDGEIASGIQAPAYENAFLYEYVHGFPVTFIGPSFDIPKTVTALELPESVVGILSQGGEKLDAKGAFYKNEVLSTFISCENLSYIGNKAFYGCTSLKNVFLPIKLAHIGDRAFYGCTSLENISVYGETSIGEGAFAGCGALTDVYLSEKVKRVGLGAFENTPFYDNLTEEFGIVGDVLVKYNGNGGDVVIPDGVRIIADGVFAGKLSVKSVSFPESVEYIGNSAFRSCARLSAVTFGTEAYPAIGVNAFDGCSENVLQTVSGLTVDARDVFYSELNAADLKLN